MTAHSEICHLGKGVQPLLQEAPVWSLTSSSSEALGLELRHGLEEVEDPSLAATVDSGSKSGTGSMLTEVPQTWREVGDEARGPCLGLPPEMSLLCSLLPTGHGNGEGPEVEGLSLP